MILEKDNLPKYKGGRFFLDRRKLMDGTIITRVYDTEHGYCLVVDNHWDTAIRLILPNKKSLQRAYKGVYSTGEGLIKSVFKSEPEAYCFNPERADMELGDKVWILLKNMNEIESTRIDFLEDGSLKDYDSGIIYTPDEIAAVQRRIPYDLIDDPDFLKFCGR